VSGAAGGPKNVRVLRKVFIMCEVQYPMRKTVRNSLVFVAVVLALLVGTNELTRKVNNPISVHPAAKLTPLYRAIITVEAEVDSVTGKVQMDGNIGKLAKDDLIIAGYDYESMSHEERFYAYTTLWITRKSYEDNDWIHAMIWRGGPNGPDKAQFNWYGDKVVKLARLYQKEDTAP